MIVYTQAKKEDLEQIIELLSENDLPGIDVHFHIKNFIVAKKGGKIIGSIGFEKYGTEALLRSFAVTPEERNKKIGKELYNHLVYFSKDDGINTLHLLTTTAERYFTRQNFRIADRETKPEAIKNTLEFSQLCPSSSIYMKKNI